MERKTGIISGQDYMVHRLDVDPLHVEPVEMQPQVEYSLPRRVIERIKTRLGVSSTDVGNRKDVTE